MSKSEQPKLPNRGIALIPDPNQKLGQEPTIHLGWCIAPCIEEALKKAAARNPYLLFVVWNEAKRRVKHTLVPLRRGEAWVQLTAPGRNIIYATVVFETSNRVRSVQSWLQRNYEGYRLNAVQDFNGTVYEYLLAEDATHMNTVGIASLELSVGKEYFAPDPPAWFSELVNLWHRNKPFDECEFRWRMLICLVKVWPAIVFYTIKNLIYLFMALCFMMVGRVKMRYQVFLQPWNYDLHRESLAAIPFERTWFNKYPVLMPLLPAALLIETGFGIMIGDLFKWTLNWQGVLAGLGVAVGGVYGIIMAIFLVVMLLRGIGRLWFKTVKVYRAAQAKQSATAKPTTERQCSWLEKLALRFSDWWEKREKAADVKRDAAMLKRREARAVREVREQLAAATQRQLDLVKLEQTVRAVVCNKSDALPSFEELGHAPTAVDRVIMLRDETKKRVCRPFAR